MPEVLAVQDGSSEPLVMTKCTTFIEDFVQKEGNSCACNIYSATNYSREFMKRLRFRFRRDGDGDIDFVLAEEVRSFNDICTVAALLKQFFMEIPGPFFPRESYGHIVRSGLKRVAPLSSLTRTLRSSQMSPARMAMLSRLIQHLRTIGAAKDQAVREELANIWAPLLFRGYESVDGLEVHRKVIDVLLGADPSRLRRS